MGGGGCAGAGLCVHGSSLHAQSIRLPLSGRVGREPKLARHFLKSVGPDSALHFPCCALWFVRSCLGLCRARLRSEEHTSELQSLMRISYAVFCLTKKTHIYK